MSTLVVSGVTLGAEGGDMLLFPEAAMDVGMGAGILSLGGALALLGRKTLPWVLYNIKNGFNGNPGRSRRNGNKISEGEFRGELITLTKDIRDTLRNMDEDGEALKELVIRHDITAQLKLDSLVREARKE